MPCGVKLERFESFVYACVAFYFSFGVGTTMALTPPSSPPQLAGQFKCTGSDNCPCGACRFEFEEAHDCVSVFAVTVDVHVVSVTFDLLGEKIKDIVRGTVHSEPRDGYRIVLYGRCCHEPGSGKSVYDVLACSDASFVRKDLVDGLKDGLRHSQLGGFVCVDMPHLAESSEPWVRQWILRCRSMVYEKSCNVFGNLDDVCSMIYPEIARLEN
ncbi:hypothetical protein V8C35DRAFT_311854 [Trichoderma chlorosporum]